MDSLSIIGAFIITVALLLYGIGNIALQRFKIITIGVLWFVTLGVFSDFLAITLMILGSTKGAFTSHGILGYTATLTMVINLILIWNSYIKNGMDSVAGKTVILFSKIAYGWWLIAYLTGSLLVIWNRG